MTADILPFRKRPTLHDELAAQIDAEIVAFMAARGQPYLATRREHVRNLLGDIEFYPDPPEAA